MTGNLDDFLHADEARCMDALLAALPWDEARAARVQVMARDLVERTRAAKAKSGQLESFLRQYGLDTEEGLALMTLAEALLRIPDAATQDALIRDKIKAAEWFARGKDGEGGSKDLLVRAAGFGLSLTRKTLDSALAKIGEPVIRRAMHEAMRMLGRQFVLGRTIEEGIKEGRAWQKRGCRLSFDMLGEGARTAADGQKFFKHYTHAIEAASGTSLNGLRPGVSVKLSALHPRYEWRQASSCLPVMTERLRALARLARERDVALTVDAEEVDRLEISLTLIEDALAQEALAGWDGFGLAIQAYSKRTLPLIARLADMATKHSRRLQVRLVKGAYWDTEVKRAQALGLPEYPVFTRKANTDVCYLACAKALLDRRDIFYPMLATHNAHTIAAVYELAGPDKSGFEYQRLHGMGETLYDQVLADKLAPVCVYAPCGSHEELLPYLVRRLLENGANSSFINKLLDPATPVTDIMADPVRDVRAHREKRHPHIPLPRDLFKAEGRVNSPGLDLTDPATLDGLQAAARLAAAKSYEAAPLIGNTLRKGGAAQPVRNPADHTRVVGQVWNGDAAAAAQAVDSVRQSFPAWTARPPAERAAILERIAGLYERNRDELIALVVREAGRTYDDALGEWREAVDFCRYYAARGSHDFAPVPLPGPTGESNRLTLHGRGVFACLSPWNFPLSIFTGQIVAALMAGNGVVAKPAGQTPLIALRAVQLMIEAGVPKDAIALLPGGPETGQALVEHPGIAGVAFTGSAATARAINRALAAKDGPIVPLIAETGGQNAMLVDSSALPEQVVDDVIGSAFGSAGQRCSALRVLYLQDDIADTVIRMLQGAMAERVVGDPAAPQTDIGPVIDEAARARLEIHRAWLEQNGKLVAVIRVDPDVAARGTFFAPVAYEISSIRQLTGEVFGPVLHIVRYKSAGIAQVIADINATGYGLTFGVHSRIRGFIDGAVNGIDAGNIYVNRMIIGAVVGAQPFGGNGLSGTGPKAGGPHYLPRFAAEKVVSIDTARQGGNASLLSLKE